MRAAGPVSLSRPRQKALLLPHNIMQQMAHRFHVPDDALICRTSIIENVIKLALMPGRSRMCDAIQCKICRRPQPWASNLRCFLSSICVNIPILHDDTEHVMIESQLGMSQCIHHDQSFGSM